MSDYKQRQIEIFKKETRLNFDSSLSFHWEALSDWLLKRMETETKMREAIEQRKGELFAENGGLKSRMERYEGALKFYAWADYRNGTCDRLLDDDGEIARQALKGETK